MVAKVTHKMRSFKLWSAITGVALVVALVLTFLPYEASIDTGGILSISLRQTSANPGIGEFSYKKKLTFNTTAISVTTNQTNFPVCVHINSSSWTNSTERDNFFGAWNVGGKRCQFFDSNGTTNLDYEVDLYNSGTPEAIYWARVPQVDGNSTADYIWCAFGNDPNGSDQDNHEGVWDANFKFVNHMDYLPLFAQTTNLGNAAEFSLIMDGSQCDAWYATAPYFETLYYSYATDSDLNSYSAGQSCLTDIRCVFVLREGSTYYLFAHKIISPHVWSQDIYLWSSTNKTTWSILNGGNPVFTADGSGNYKYIWNVGVVVIGSVWHMFLECGSQSDQSDVGLGYSYSNLTDLNWNTHKSADHILDGGGNPQPVYVPDRSAIMLITGKGNPSYWEIVGYSASTSSDLSLAASWSQCRNFKISYPSMHTADPHLVVAGDAFDYNIVIAYFYNQATSYQAYIDLSLNDFYDRIQYPIDSTSNQIDGTKRGTFEPTQVAGVVVGGQDFDGSNDYIDLGNSANLSGNTQTITFTLVDKGTNKTAYILARNPNADEWARLGILYNANYLVLCAALDGSHAENHNVVTWASLASGDVLSFVYKTTSVDFYKNGTYVSNIAFTTYDFDNVPTAKTSLGRAGEYANYFFDGTLDEVRLSGSNRVADWIKLEYYSMKKTNFNGDSWLSWGTQETAVPAITNTPDSKDFGILLVNTTSNTSINYFTITNTGGCTVDVAISGTNMTGGGYTWVISDTATPGNMIFGMKAGLDDADDLFDVVVNTTANAFVSDLPEATTQAWGIKIWSPTSYDDGNLKTGNVTLTAVAS